MQKIKTKILTRVFNKISQILENILQHSIERGDFDRFDKFYQLAAQLDGYCVVYCGIYLD
jgi:hypothetical protein